MEWNIFFTLSIVALCSAVIVPFIVGMIGIGYGKCLFGKTLFIITSLFLSFLVCGLVYDCFIPHYLNDVRVKIHYLDGYSEVIMEKGIMDNDLPCLIRTNSGLSLKCANRYYHGVIRYEYVSRERYMVDE